MPTAPPPCNTLPRSLDVTDTFWFGGTLRAPPHPFLPATHTTRTHHFTAAAAPPFTPHCYTDYTPTFKPLPTTDDTRSFWGCDSMLYICGSFLGWWTLVALQPALFTQYLHTAGCDVRAHTAARTRAFRTTTCRSLDRHIIPSSAMTPPVARSACHRFCFSLQPPDTIAVLDIAWFYALLSLPRVWKDTTGR